MKKIAVIGAGGWGTALAQTLARKGNEIYIYDVNREHLAEIAEKRENVRYLPGTKLDDNIHAEFDEKSALDGADAVIFSVPTQFFRGAFSAALPFITKDMLIVNVAKGIEQNTLMRMSEIAYELIGSAADDYKYVVLSGPSHAEEVILGLPTTVSVASGNKAAALEAQDLFITNRFRVYTSEDACGLELGGALKNVIALGAGISDGLGFGDNAKAALMTRGITEITRLGTALGADEFTFSGLAGIGDLIVTCTSMHSRNRRCGIMIGEGIEPGEAVKRVGAAVEGMYTCSAAYELAKREGIEMPITETIYGIINGQITPAEAVEALMGRKRKQEHE